MGTAPVQRVVIVGASLAGLTTAEALRSDGFTGDILLLGAEPELPYSRPPLSKQVLSGLWAADQAVLRSAAELEAVGIRTRLGAPATGLDRRERVVQVGDERIPYDVLVIATGVAARGSGDIADGPIPTLRTMDDARRLRAELERSERIAVLGSGVLGSEIASAARAADRRTTLIGRSRELSLGAVGRLLSPRLTALHRGAGVDLRLGSAVTAVEGPPDTVRRVRLADGTSIEADLVVAATGGIPQTAWLQGSGLDIQDGVRCDRHGLAAPGIFAVGDVARWAHPLTGVARRIEHQTNAIEQALAVGRAIATGEPPRPEPPFFWSELHGVRIQAYGHFDPLIPLTPFGEPLEPGREVLASIGEEGTAGVVGWNAAKAFRAARLAVDEQFRAGAPASDHAMDEGVHA